MRLVCFSDIHSNFNNVKVPFGDVLIFAGDFSAVGREVELLAFASWFNRHTHKHKIVVAGNHDRRVEFLGPRETTRILTVDGAYPNTYYLENRGVEIDGVKFYGSPYTPEFGDWAFMRPRSKIGRIWYGIPDDTNVLITHGPPYGINDLSGYENEHAGCEALYNRVKQLEHLKLHVFGHIHLDRGGSVVDGVTFANVSCCNNKNEIVGQPFIFDL